MPSFCISFISPLCSIFFCDKEKKTLRKVSSLCQCCRTVSVSLSDSFSLSDSDKGVRTKLHLVHSLVLQLYTSHYKNQAGFCELLTELASQSCPWHMHMHKHTNRYTHTHTHMHRHKQPNCLSHIHKKLEHTA